MADAGKVGSRVERSKGLKDAEGLGCVLVGGPVELATPTDEEEMPLQGLKTKMIIILTVLLKGSEHTLIHVNGDLRYIIH